MSVQTHYSLGRLRSSLLHFLIGKAGTAVLNFAAFMLVVRLLDVVDYGRYVALLALVELLMSLGNFGLDWVAARYVPEYRVRASGRELARFIFRLSGLQALIYALFALALVALGPRVLQALSVSAESLPVLYLYAAFLFADGCSRVLRDYVLGHLLLQGWIQMALVLRNLSWVLGLLFLGKIGASLPGVATVELLAASMGLLVAFAGVSKVLIEAQQSAKPIDKDWSAPTVRECFVLARSSYLSYLFALAYGPQLVTLILSRLTGEHAVAVFGFARNLAEQVRRYLPAEMFLGLARPAIVARYAESGDFAAFNRNTSLLFCVSLFALVPMLAMAFALGSPLAALLSAGKYPESGLLLSLFLCVLLPFSHRRCVEMVANTVGQSPLCVSASARLLMTPVVIAVLLWFDMPLWSVVAMAVLAECGFSLFVVQALRQAGFPYLFPWRPVLRSGGVVVIVALVLAVLPLHEGSWLEMTLAALGSGVLSLAFLWLVKPFDPAEQQRLFAMLRVRRSSGVGT